MVDGLYFLKHRIHEYSSPAMTMNPKHTQFHLTRAVALPPDLGELATTEFRVLIAHRDRVSRMPTLAGMASYGTRKLTYHVIILYNNLGNFNLGVANTVYIGFYDQPP